MAKFLYLVAYNVYYYVRHRGQAGPRDREAEAFDLAHGVETAEIREIGTLDISSDNARHAVRYQPTGRTLFTRALAACQVEHHDFSFIDFGCGKGAVMLFASAYPFRSIIGVEFSPELAAIAERNIREYRNTAQRCRDLRVVCIDASGYDPPTDPLVCYFYNPFGAVVLRRVMENLERSRRAHPREMFAIYVDPRSRDVFDQAAHWRCVADEGGFVVYAGSGIPPRR